MQYHFRIVGEAAHPTSPTQHRGGNANSLVLQEQDRVEHVPTKKKLADTEKYSWPKPPRYDYSPADRMRICLNGGQPHRVGEWADTAARPLKDQLAEIVQEVDLRGLAAERKRLADVEEAQPKRLRWEAAKPQATIEYAEAYRIRHLEAQHSARRHAAGPVEYVGALRFHAEYLPTRPARGDAEAWIAWAEGHAQRLDPLNGSPLLRKSPSLAQRTLSRSCVA
ncbi:hypothetical protein [Streptomyces sp. NBC_00212]|uniref:hypothetical protein n=1 Tax=Streptomyces sp. NBC_00212 TaxID=2975684 RepID=UPI00324431FD